MKVLGFDLLPDKDTVSRYKDGIDIDGIMRILMTMIRSLDEDFMCMVGVDSTSLPAFSRIDPDAWWATTT